MDALARKFDSIVGMYEANADDASRMHDELKTSAEALAARQYLNARGFDDDALDMFNVGYGPMMDDDSFSGRIVFPIVDLCRHVCGFTARAADDETKPKYVTSIESDSFQRGKHLYGADKVFLPGTWNGRRHVIVCGSPLDVIRCHRVGFTNAIAILGGLLEEDQVRLLEQYADEVIVVCRCDDAERRNADRTASILRAAGMEVRVVLLPDGHDPDSFIRDKGTEEFRREIGI